jgi:hypothetical protein
MIHSATVEWIYRTCEIVLRGQMHQREPSMSVLNSVVAVYDTHEQAEAAIKELQEAGVDMKSLSIAGRNTHSDEHVVGY